MAIARQVNDHIEYTVPAHVQTAAPVGYVYAHFVWFDNWAGHWMGEWAGYVPESNVSVTAVGDERRRAMNAWCHDVQRRIGPRQSDYLTLDDDWDVTAWDACEAGGAVCLQVSQFGWPVGDHRFHVWHRQDRRIDWPDESVHTFIEIRTDTLEVVANQRSHRPVRDAVLGQHVIDITETPWASHYGKIFGHFVWRGDRWGFEPSRVTRTWTWRQPLASLRTLGTPLVPPPTRRALMEAPLDFFIPLRSPVYADKELRS